MTPRAKLPWFKQYPANYISGVAGMDAEYIGVYTVLYNLMYARRAKLETRGKDDMQKLARICGVSTRRFGQVLADLLRMPNKITMDDSGRLSNPKFERMTASKEGDDDGEKEQNGEHFGAIFERENSTKSRRKEGDKSRENQPTLFKNNDLTTANPVPARARARHRGTEEQKEVCNEGGSAAAPNATAEHMDPSGFKQWVAACRRTIPRGWSIAKAERQWLRLPFSPVDTMVKAWTAYIEHNRAESKTARYPKKTQYPENWWRDRAHLDFLAQVEQQTEAEHHAAAARQKRDEDRAITITQWNGSAQKVIAKIGAAKFDALFVGVTLTHQGDAVILDFHKNDTARSNAEQYHGDHLAQVFGNVHMTSDHKRQRDAEYAAKARRKP